MVMIEAMASGTAVVALGGAVAEVVEHGVTGFVCREPAELVEPLDNVSALRAPECRLRVEEHFSASIMAARYEQVYVAALDRSHR